MPAPHQSVFYRPDAIPVAQSTASNHMLHNYCFWLSVLFSALNCLQFGGRKGIRPVKKLSGGMLAWLCVWVKVQICTWPSWCHCHSLSLAPVNPDWFYFSGAGSPGRLVVFDKIQEGHKTVVCVCVFLFWNASKNICKTTSIPLMRQWDGHLLLRCHHQCHVMSVCDTWWRRQTSRLMMNFHDYCRRRCQDHSVHAAPSVVRGNPQHSHLPPLHWSDRHPMVPTLHWNLHSQSVIHACSLPHHSRLLVQVAHERYAQTNSHSPLFIW